MLVKALISFCGIESMASGEIKEITDKYVIDDLVKAGYIEKMNPEKHAKKKSTGTKEKTE